MQFSWWTFLLQGVNFLVLVWLLHRFLYKPVQEVIAKRKEMTTAALDQAHDAERTAQQTKEQYESALADIDKERADVLDKVRQEVETERRKVLDEAREQAATIVDKAKATISEEREAARHALKRDTATLAADLAARILTDMSASIPAAATLDYVVKEINDLPEAERARVDSELRANGSEVEIVTASELDAAAREQWQSRLEGELGHSIAPRFSCDAGIISGAILKLPHTAIRVTWADQISDAREHLLEGDHG
jgi:F-type H+-transporting ATPase subunit b